MRRATRRELLLEALAGAGALALAGCGSAQRARSGSTLSSTWSDLHGDGQLRMGPGEPLLERLELGPRARPIAELATLAHVTDAHVLDASSPARVTFLNRLGPPFESTFRPQETLSVQVLAGAAATIRGLRPRVVIQGGDLIDNDQSNELAQAMAALRGGWVRPGSGRDGYYGVQSAFDPDPFYYRPDLDAPRHPGLLRAAVAPFFSLGLGAHALPVLGDHDTLVAGEVVPTSLTESLATGDRALWELPAGLSLPSGALPPGGGSPDGPLNPGPIDDFIAQALSGPTVRVPPDSDRRELAVGEVIGRLAAFGATRPRTAVDGERLDYALDLGPHLRLVVLDLVRRGGGSGGLVGPDQPAWLEQQLATAGRRWVIVASHQPLSGSLGGDLLLDVLDASPRVAAAVSGHTHRNRIEPRHTSRGGYWLISTASLIDYPQQARAIRVVSTAGGGVALKAWMLDHSLPGRLGSIARELSYLDAQGGRPNGFAGARLDRNVVLYRAAAG